MVGAGPRGLGVSPRVASIGVTGEGQVYPALGHRERSEGVGGQVCDLVVVLLYTFFVVEMSLFELLRIFSCVYMFYLVIPLLQLDDYAEKCAV